jgi:hypothetical protein
MKPVITTVLLLIPFLGFSQATLNRPENVESQNFLRYSMSNFSNPKIGQNQIWDFRHVLLDENPSNIRLIVYTSEDTIFITHTDGHTANYNYLHKNQYVQTRYEKNHLRVSYSTPQVLLQYPLRFQQSFNSRFEGILYHQLDQTLPMKGRNSTSLVGYGSLILPNGDILNNVFMVRSQVRHARTEEKLLERFQNVFTFYTSESIVPIMEISYQMRRCSSSNKDDLESRWAYYYEPEPVQMPFNTAPFGHFSQASPLLKEHQNTEFFASIAPNPVRDQTVVTLNLHEATTVFLEIHTLQGKQVHKAQWDFPIGGIYRQSLYLNQYNLLSGTYLVTIRLNGKTETHKIQKI